MARRDDRRYREYLTEEQRSQPGCPARGLVQLMTLPGTQSPRRDRVMVLIQMDGHRSPDVRHLDELREGRRRDDPCDGNGQERRA